MDIREKRTFVFIVVVLLVFGAATYLGRSPQRHNVTEYSLPQVIGQWQGQEVSYDRSLLISWLGTDHIVFREYRNVSDGRVVTVYIAYYPDMETSDMAHAPEVCYPGQGWEIRSNKTVNLVLSGDRVRVKRMAIEKGKSREIVYFWWQTLNTVIAENWQYRLLMVANRLLRADTASLWVRISSEDTRTLPGAPEAAENIIAFSSEIHPLFEQYFRKGD